MYLAFIMDGNRRWAKSRNLTKKQGHEKGFLKILNLIDWGIENKIDKISTWCLAKKNIEEREKQEIEDIYSILENLLIGKLKNKCLKKGVKFDYIGDVRLLPNNLLNELKKLKDSTKDNNGLNFTLVIAYGGQDEINRGLIKFIQENKELILDNNFNLESIFNERTILNYLDSGKLSPPDIIIRTGGHNRHSGFFLYQSEYSEYLFFKKYWPSFNKNDFKKSVNYLNNSTRNFGKCYILNNNNSIINNEI